MFDYIYIYYTLCICIIIIINRSNFSGETSRATSNVSRVQFASFCYHVPAVGGTWLMCPGPEPTYRALQCSNKDTEINRESD